MKKPMITHQELTRLINYSPETGEFRWREKPARQVAIGSIAGCMNQRGYWAIQISGRIYAAHRLAWLYSYGEWPKGQIDHINHDRIDNRLSNLREVTRSENLRNAKRSKNNKSGVTGVVIGPRPGKWEAFIRHEGKAHRLGTFNSKQEAAVARKAAERFCGYHPNHGQT